MTKKISWKINLLTWGSDIMKRFATSALIFSFAAGSAVVAGTPAFAADLPAKVYTKAPPPVAATNWTGCYVGAEAGYSWGREGVVEVPTATMVPGATVTSIKPSGGLGGGTVGCNWQYSQFVVGVEGDISASGLRGSAGDMPPFNAAFSHAVSTTWLDTFRGRAGLVWNNALVYATAGAAFTNVRDSAAGNSLGVTATNNRTGWVAGVGVEYMFAPNWSAKFEYLYADFGTIHDSFDVAPPAGTFVGVNTRLTENIIRAGINYHFNWGGPVVAKY